MTRIDRIKVRLAGVKARVSALETEDGAAMLEYGFLLLGVALAVIFGAALFGFAVADLFGLPLPSL